MRSPRSAASCSTTSRRSSRAWHGVHVRSLLRVKVNVSYYTYPAMIKKNGQRMVTAKGRRLLLEADVHFACALLWCTVAEQKNVRLLAKRDQKQPSAPHLIFKSQTL